MRRPYQDYSAVLLIAPNGTLQLQRRDDLAGIMYPGYLSLFGGGFEVGETPIGCALREIEEETGLRIAASDLIPLADVTYYHPGRGPMREYVFYATVNEVDPKAVTEGRLELVALENAREYVDEMDPLAFYTIQKYQEQI